MKGTVEGQVFIRTESGASIELGLVDVFAVDPEIFRKSVAISDSLAEARVREQVPDLVEKLKAVESANGWRQETERRESAERAMKMAAKYQTASYLLSSLTLANDTAKTDASGEFQLQLSATDTTYLVAWTERSIGDETEHYHWVVPVKPKADTTTRVLLANDNEGYLYKNRIIPSRADLESARFVVTNAATGGELGGGIDLDGNWATVARYAVTKPDSLRSLVE